MGFFIIIALAGGVASSIYCCYKTFENDRTIKVDSENELDQPFLDFLKKEKEDNEKFFSKKKFKSPSEILNKNFLFRNKENFISKVSENEQIYNRVPEFNEQICCENAEKESLSIEENPPFCKENLPLKKIGFFVCDKDGNNISV
jgi:hypothetical protein